MPTEALVWRATSTMTATACLQEPPNGQVQSSATDTPRAVTDHEMSTS